MQGRNHHEDLLARTRPHPCWLVVLARHGYWLPPTPTKLAPVGQYIAVWCFGIIIVSYTRPSPPKQKIFPQIKNESG
ncbi:MAG: hypothetical protein MJE68_26255 [Proteobacteria bacterium]|nr:hypothetical protein [Pseudomonadota bacterium]